ncbi:hypothetical protein HZS61_008320 [Fusarium oxysporum f. sp. conglutinans]|uniref:VWFA domain-containing protein n=1 Tax=Fusarium oxysporum f. sp. conglutinans TaxID=100902 RepID=A0A8H6LQ33_FUSOX|nr:hypothetical protein HZS61_008320 [Fusarium oxysporum f. sp. conglutinans]KAI8416857.1 hypothetical protein FOFC_03170 [Fusarium oxysporum]
MFSRIKDKFSNKKPSTEDHTHFDRGNSHSNPKNNPFLDVPEEAPPAYEPTQKTVPLLNVPRRGASPAPSISSITNAEDKYAFLSTFDTIFIIDDSGSMAGRSWREVREALRTIAPISVGTGVQAPGGYFQIRDANQVQYLFESVQPYGATPTGSRLHSILTPYVAHLSRRAANVGSTKPVNIIVITDGCPTDDPESIIIHHAKKLDQIEAPPHQVGIQFFQVGNELGATKALRELDDDLADQGIRDMVDTATWNSATSEKSNVLTADGILKVVLGAVVRRLDRRPNSKLSSEP